MKEGVELLIKHISQNNNAVIIIDSDADGYTSSAILMNYLNNFFPNWI
jgi:single-stranded-DNA-specific exonuclease